MSTESFALFAHLVAVVAGFMLAGVMHAGLFLTRSATTVAELKPWPRVIRRLEPLLGISTLGIFGTGVWLIVLHDEFVAWTDGWMVWSILALLVVQVVGLLFRPRETALFAAIEGAKLEDPVSDDMRPDGVIFLMGHLSTALVLGILYLMVFKPSAVGSVVVVAVSVALGVVSALPFLRPSVRSRGAPAATGV